MIDIAKRITAEKRQIRSMRQFRDLPEADIERMAIDRIRSGKTSGRRQQPPHPEPTAECPLEYLGGYYRDEGVALFEDPWWISAYADSEPSVDDDQSELPYREYRAYLMRHSGKRYVCLALDWEPA